MFSVVKDYKCDPQKRDKDYGDVILFSFLGSVDGGQIAPQKKIYDPFGPHICIRACIFTAPKPTHHNLLSRVPNINMVLSTRKTTQTHTKEKKNSLPKRKSPFFPLHMYAMMMCVFQLTEKGQDRAKIERKKRSQSELTTGS